MKNKWIQCGIGVFLSISLSAQTVSINGSNITLKNKFQELNFALDKGLFEIKASDGTTVAQNIFFQMGGIQSKEDHVARTHQITETKDALGNGKTLTVRIRVNQYPDVLWQATMYNDKDFLVFNMGLANDTDKPHKIMCFYPFVSNNVYTGMNNDTNYKVLEGTSGGGRTIISKDRLLTSFNNLLVRFGCKEQTKILVAGGLTYNEFDKFVTVQKEKNNLRLQLFSEDPVGKLVDADSTYWLNEKFYFCFNNTDPFTALEKYAHTLKTAQNVRLNMYDFPTECLWYASFYNNEKGRRKFNDSKGAVEEMDNAIASGFTRYTRVAIRLVPDAYGKNNQQGWWDDKHWAMYGEGMSTEGPHYIAPYLTTDSWAQAILKKGGLPITYFQSGRRSEDYAMQHPGHMLFNDPFRVINTPERFTMRVNEVGGYDTGYFNHWWSDKMLWGYDFTDPGFITHMQQVYKNLHRAGIRGIMYDYPEVTSYAFEGGFEDKHKTTAWAYRNMFKLAYEGLGPDCYLDERNLLRGSDITLGLVASQRVWADTDGITPEMVTRCGLRWYKNRTVINYDMDSKDPSDAQPLTNNDGSRSLYTMCYVTSGRFLLGRSFNQLSQQQLRDMSRTFPYHTSAQSARPIDAFNEGTEYPRIYDFKVTEKWHQLTLYNYNMDSSRPEKNRFEVSLGGSLNEGGMELDSAATYYIYDFWNDTLAGQIQGADTLVQILREGEARMLSVHKVEKHPQFISTDRHIMQGYVDLKDCQWTEHKRTLSGTSAVIGNDPYKIIIATNGHRYKRCKAKGAKTAVRIKDRKNGLLELTLESSRNKNIQWSVIFE